MKDNDLRQAIRFAANQSMLMQRTQLAGEEGRMMDGKRDIYESAGYPTILEPSQYLAMYRRGGIATRIVNAPCDESWRKLPIIFEGEDEKTGTTDSEFCKAWNDIAVNAFGGKGLYHYMHRLDRASGIGRFGILYFGLAGSENLTEPVTKAAKLSYVTVLDESLVSFGSIDTDRKSERFGMPLTYRLEVATNLDNSSQEIDTHWSRCLHVVDEPLTNDLFGTPRLESPYNYLVNLLKVLAGSGEAAWKLMDSGNIFTTTDNYELPPEGSEGRKRLEAMFEEYWNGLSRGMLAEGIQNVPLGGQVTDPTGLIMINISMIAATINMPQRILMGSERGNLASSQDSVAWLESIEERRQNFVAPSILRPTVTKLIEWGLLPTPRGGFGFKWDRLVKDDRMQGAQTASTMASALSTAGINIDAEEFVRVYAPEIDPKQIAKKEIPAQLAPVMDPNQDASVDKLAANELHELLWSNY